MIRHASPAFADRRSGATRNPLVATAHARLMMLMLVFAAGIIAILLRLVLLAISATPASARASADTGAPVRGDIVDRNGVPLARTIDAWSIGVHPSRIIGDRAELARQLEALMPERSAGDYAKLLSRDVNFTYLRHRALPELVEQVNALGEPGIVFAREPQRMYPQASLAAHALGYVTREGAGGRGMERALDDQLTDPKRRGQPAQLSIDMRVQAALQSELTRAMNAHQAAGAAAVILDVDTGEVMAMASLPTFNPNNIRGASDDQLRNNVTQSRYELGSTFKPLSLAAAIESGVVPSIAKRYDATQPLPIGRFRIRDDHAQRRWLNVAETLVHSSNIATARIADEMGQARMEALFRGLGFDQRSEIEIRERDAPIWPGSWGRATTLTTAYGHGIAITPLHLATAYAAMVNGGIVRPATMLKVAPGTQVAGHRVYSQATSDKMRALLRLIVTDGSGRRAEAAGYRVGGKTGTGEKPGKGGYSRSVNVSTFAAAFPMDAPRYVVIAMLDSPKGNAETFGLTTAAWTAAPVVQRTILRAGPMLGVIPDARRDIDLAQMRGLLWKAPGERKTQTAATAE